ncbi:MAG TPA: 5-oxoprolinase subunit PxpB [Opitutaceae bacterium]|jgi:inhibitor of KinA
MKLEPLGDSAVVATLGSGVDDSTLAAVAGLAAALAGAKSPGIFDVVPAYDTVTVFYDALRLAPGPGDPYAAVCRQIEACAARSGPGLPRASRRVEIPVCYAGEFGPDLAEVATGAGLSPEAVVALHSKPDYRVHAIGFMPGFGYLGGLPAALHTPRRATPRERVPAGSVGIGGAQTGVYPIASPGGWQLIGRTPLALFRPNESPAALLRPADQVRFRPISRAEFDAWR